MTTIFFDLKEFSGVAWDRDTVPLVTFRASRPGVSPQGAFAGAVEATPASDGSVVVELEPTVGMLGPVSYALELSWVEGGTAKRAFWDYRLEVPGRDTPVPLMDLIGARPHDLYEVIEFSAGTTDSESRPIPHSSKTTMWFRDTGDRYKRMIWSD